MGNRKGGKERGRKSSGEIWGDLWEKQSNEEEIGGKKGHVNLVVKGVLLGLLPGKKLL